MTNRSLPHESVKGAPGKFESGTDNARSVHVTKDSRYGNNNNQKVERRIPDARANAVFETIHASKDRFTVTHMNAAFAKALSDKK